MTNNFNHERCSGCTYRTNKPNVEPCVQCGEIFDYAQKKDIKSVNVKQENEYYK